VKIDMEKNWLFLTICYTYLPIVIIGGFIAVKKGDYFTRGAAITAFTWIFGLLSLLLAPPSKARQGDKEDLEGWHAHGATGGTLFLVFICCFLIYMAHSS
jgi:hypothetical protein